MTARNDWRTMDLPGYTKLVNGRDGVFVVNPHDIYVGRALLHYGEYSQGEADLFTQVLHLEDIVVEVGANMGAHTVGLAKRVGPRGRVVAFEPQGGVFQLLCGNIALNGLINVDCHQAALGAAPGSVHLPLIDYAQENNFGGIALDQLDGPLRVPVWRLDDMFPYDRLALLKVDVEGMEQAVLEGAAGTIAKFQPLLYLENDRVERSAALIRCAWDMGYDLWWHVPRMYNPANHFANPTNIYGGTASCNMLGIPRTVRANIAGLPKVEDAEFNPARR